MPGKSCRRRSCRQNPRTQLVGCSHPPS
jgi:hypothetical protein